MTALRWILCALLFVAALLLGLLSLGLLSALAANGPLWLRSLGTVANAVTISAGMAGWSGAAQALTLMLLTSAVAGVAAYAKPRG